MIEVTREECAPLARKRFDFFFGRGRWTGQDFGPETNFARIEMGVRGEIAAMKSLHAMGVRAEINAVGLKEPDLSIEWNRRRISIDVKATPHRSRTGELRETIYLPLAKFETYTRLGWRLIAVYLGDWPRAWVSRSFDPRAIEWRESRGDDRGTQCVIGRLADLQWIDGDFASIVAESMR